MKKIIILVAVPLLCSSLVQAKMLSVRCAAHSGVLVGVMAEIQNVNNAAIVNTFEVNAMPMKSQDVSELPLYKEGTFKMKFNFGPNLYSSLSFQVSNCTDSFLSSGSATINKYVGGYSGTTSEPMNCTCELK